MPGPRVCMECSKPIRDKVYISIPGLSPNSICIDCTEPFVEKARNEATRSIQSGKAVFLSMRSVVTQIVNCQNTKSTARKNIPTTAGIKFAVDIGVLKVEDLKAYIAELEADA